MALSEEFCAGLERDQRERATMSMLVPPQMLNTIAPGTPADEVGFTGASYADPEGADLTPAAS